MAELLVTKTNTYKENDNIDSMDYTSTTNYWLVTNNPRMAEKVIINEFPI